MSNAKPNSNVQKKSRKTGSKQQNINRPNTMKKLRLIAIAATTVAAISHGQGTIVVNNLENTGFQPGGADPGFPPVYSASVTANGLVFTEDPAAQAGNLGDPAGGALMGLDFSWALYGGASPDASMTLLASATTPAEIAGDNVNWGGLWGSANAVSVLGSVPNSTVYLDLYVWEGNIFPSFTTAIAAGDGVGVTGVFANPSGGGTEPPPSLVGMPDVLISAPEPGLVIWAPEPGTLTLTALGGASLLLLRFRKH
ncbi:MAG: hypothetical protein ABSH48_04450 [Verrucomicrobiota bacterium]